MPESFKNRLTTTSKNRCKNKAACPELPGGSAARAGAPLTHLIISSRLVFVSFLSCLPRSRLRFVRKSKRLLKNADRSIAKATDATHIVVRRSLVSGCESQCASAEQAHPEGVEHRVHLLLSAFSMVFKSNHIKNLETFGIEGADVSLLKKDATHIDWSDLRMCPPPPGPCTESSHLIYPYWQGFVLIAS